jgi:hypothetical protein
LDVDDARLSAAHGKERGNTEIKRMLSVHKSLGGKSRKDVDFSEKPGAAFTKGKNDTLAFCECVY